MKNMTEHLLIIKNEFDNVDIKLNAFFVTIL